MKFALVIPLIGYKKHQLVMKTKQCELKC